MTGFEPWISGIGSGHSAKLATTTAIEVKPRSDNFYCARVVNLSTIGRPLQR